MKVNHQQYGYIYAIGSDGSQLVKIGSTYDAVQSRRNNLQIGASGELHIKQEIRVENPRADIEQVRTSKKSFTFR